MNRDELDRSVGAVRKAQELLRGSPEVAEALARGVRDALASSVGVSITGMPRRSPTRSAAWLVGMERAMPARPSA